jgi:hypothetical protein
MLFSGRCKKKDSKPLQENIALDDEKEDLDCTVYSNVTGIPQYAWRIKICSQR